VWHFDSYDELLSEHTGSHHPLVAGLALILFVIVAVLLFI